MSEHAQMAQHLSRLLFYAREQVSMWADVVEIRTGQTATDVRRVLDDLDAFREAQGWSPNGFGDESDPLVLPEAARRVVTKDQTVLVRRAVEEGLMSNAEYDVTVTLVRRIRAENIGDAMTQVGDHLRTAFGEENVGIEAMDAQVVRPPQQGA